MIRRSKPLISEDSVPSKTYHMMVCCGETRPLDSEGPCVFLMHVVRTDRIKRTIEPNLPKRECQAT